MKYIFSGFFFLLLVASAHAATYPDGALLRASNDIKVYVAFKGKIRWIKSPAVFEAYNYRWSAIRVIPPAELALLKKANLVRNAGDTRVYVINDQGFKRHIRNPDVFNSYGYDWSDIAVVNEAEFAEYADSHLAKTADSDRVYYTASGTRFWINSLEAFDTYRFSWSEVHLVNSSELELYGEGGDVTPTSAPAVIRSAVSAETDISTPPTTTTTSATSVVPIIPGNTASSVSVTSTATSTTPSSGGGSTGSTSTTPTPPSDTAPPSLSNIEVVFVTDLLATVRWSTNESASSRLEYATSTPIVNPSVATDLGLKTSHAFNLSNLKGGTTYYFKVASTDASGNTATSTNSFTTQPTAPPATTFNHFDSWNDDDPFGEVELGWESNEPAAYTLYVSASQPVNSSAPIKKNIQGHTDGNIWPRSTGSVLFPVYSDAALAWEMRARGPEDLIPEATYYFIIVSSDDGGNTVTSTEHSFATPIVWDPTPPAISNVQVTNIGASSATVNWDVYEAGLMQFGGALCFSSASSALSCPTPASSGSRPSYGRTVSLVNLTPGTLYNFEINEQDLWNGTTLHNASFTTLP